MLGRECRETGAIIDLEVDRPIVGVAPVQDQLAVLTLITLDRSQIFTGIVIKVAGMCGINAIDRDGALGEGNMFEGDRRGLITACLIDDDQTSTVLIGGGHGLQGRPRNRHLLAIHWHHAINLEGIEACFAMSINRDQTNAGIITGGALS